MPSNRLLLCRPLLPSVFPSIRVFSNESVLLIRWPNYWSFSFSISPSNDYSGLISCRIDLFDLLAVQGTLKSLLYYHNSKISVLWCLAFFMVQLSHPYMTIRKTIASMLHRITSLLPKSTSLPCQYFIMFKHSWLMNLQCDDLPLFVIYVFTRTAFWAIGQFSKAHSFLIC